MKFQAVKGMRDFYPEDMAVLNWIRDNWRRVSVRHGFQEYDGPILEDLELYTVKSGQGIVDELFHLTDRGGRDLAIRPEMTPTLARMIAAKANALPRPVKWFSIPRLCRAERPQRGRLREFFQWNIDIFGADESIADAECIFVALDFFRQVGLTPAEMVMRINSRSLLSALLVARGFEQDRHADIYAALDKRDKLPEPAYIEILQKITKSDTELAELQAIMSARGSAGLAALEGLVRGNAAAEAEMARLKEVFALLEKLGVGAYCEYDIGIVRGLAYYTGVVFEGFSKGGLQRAICGGGRYGNLLELVGGPPLSGIGFGTSDVVILDVLAEFGRLPAEARQTGAVDYFVIDADATLFDDVLSLVGQLRQKGLAAEFSYKRQNLGKQLKTASQRGARHVAIVGQKFRDGRIIEVKDMASGQQREMRQEELLA